MSPRATARAEGRKRYVSACPCPHCGSTTRYVVNAGCVTCTAEGSRLYRRGLKLQRPPRWVCPPPLAKTYAKFRRALGVPEARRLIATL